MEVIVPNKVAHFIAHSVDSTKAVFACTVNCSTPE